MMAITLFTFGVGSKLGTRTHNSQASQSSFSSAFVDMELVTAEPFYGMQLLLRNLLL